ncbi:MAG: hypothetical protein A4E55_00545 [Pelotomaculum sp. PtaU1.Bin035]|nr:MAG: hypothetical protein A4E55_00545 [Pelotomaculum sp. PtaU1.Bin035]
MDALNYLYLALDEKTSSQIYYNELSVKVTNPAARELFTRLRDEEMAYVEVLQKEIASIEAKPFPLNKIIPRLKA